MTMRISAAFLLLCLLGNRALGQDEDAADESRQCIVSGDPHYKTYDGLVGTSNGVCTYLLTTVNDGVIKVYMATEDRGEENRSWLKSITFERADIRIHITNTTIDIGGASYNLGEFTSDQQGDLQIERSGVRTCITMADDDDVNDYSEIEVCVYFAYPRAAGTITLNDNDDKVRGVCGNNNGEKPDDLNNPSEVAEADFVAMVASWKDETDGACPKA